MITSLSREYTIRGDFSKEESVRIAGDPLQQDIIVSFGNENVHWYAVIIDNRLGHKKVTTEFEVLNHIMNLTIH